MATPTCGVALCDFEVVPASDDVPAKLCGKEFVKYHPRQHVCAAHSIAQKELDVKRRC